jgi:hypothetical protein
MGSIPDTGRDLDAGRIIALAAPHRKNLPGRSHQGSLIPTLRAAQSMRPVRKDTIEVPSDLLGVYRILPD